MSNRPLTYSTSHLRKLRPKLFPRILCWVRQACWLVVSDVLNAQELEGLEECLAYMREGYGTMMRITLLDQYVTIEATHLWNSEDTDTAERTCRNIEHLALSDVRTQVAL